MTVTKNISTVDLVKEALGTTATKEELAKFLSVSPDTLDNERKRGRIQCAKVGRRIIFTAKQIADYLDRNTGF